MANEAAVMGVNGTYANGQYDGAEQNYDSLHLGHPVSNTNDYSTAAAAASTTSNHTDISKDEVGWYFVEQYYTTLSKNPEKLYLFYSKQSQFVSGTEAEKVSVCVGQKAIDDRIKELDFQDCKVRVTNVDSQGSRANIVIQVIGEISNKAQPQKKFTQTFVLAEQTNGYFVLNDIFRYIEDEDYEPVEPEQASTAGEAAVGSQEVAAPAVSAAPIEAGAPQTLTSAEDPVAQAHDAAIVDRSLEQVAKEEEEEQQTAQSSLELNGTEPAAEVAAAEDAPSAAVPTSAETPAAPAEVADVVTQTEAPLAPEPTPAPSPPKQAPAQPAAAPKPSVPKTWANLVAAGGRIAPLAATAPASVSGTSVTSAAATTKSAPTNMTSQQAPAAVPSAPAASVTPTPQDIDSPATPGSTGSEWQTAGHEHSRKQSRLQNNQQPVENSRGYIKNVTETVEQAALQEALAKVATVTYIDVSRPKNCAFVDFATPADYRAAVNANPYEVGGVRLYVEERRVRPFAPGTFPPRGGVRGGRGGAPTGPARGGMKDGGRGTFGGRGRGSFRGARGGAPQPA